MGSITTMPSISLCTLFDNDGIVPTGWSSKLLKQLLTTLGYNNNSLHTKIAGLSDSADERIDMASISESDFMVEFNELNLGCKSAARTLYRTVQALTDSQGLPFVTLSDEYVGMTATNKNLFIKEYWLSSKPVGSTPSFQPPITKRTTKYKKVVDLMSPEDFLTLKESLKAHLVANGLGDKQKDFLTGAPEDKPTALPQEESQWFISTCLMLAIPNGHELANFVSLEYHSSYIMYQLYQRFDSPVVRNRLKAGLLAELNQVTSETVRAPQMLMATIAKMENVYRKMQLMGDARSNDDKLGYLNVILSNCQDSMVRMHSQNLDGKSYNDSVTSLSQVFGVAGNPNLQSFSGAKPGRIRGVGHQSPGGPGRIEPGTVFRANKHGRLALDMDNFRGMSQSEQTEYHGYMEDLTADLAPALAAAQSKYQKFGSPKKRQVDSGNPHGGSKKKKKFSQEEKGKEDA